MSEFSGGTDHLYRLVFERSPLPMVVYDRETFSVLAANDAWVSQSEYTREELCAMTIQDLCLDEDVAVLEASPGEGSEEPSRWSEMRHRRKDGSVVPVSAISTRVEEAGSGARAVLVVDQPRDREGGAELVRSEARFRSLIENASEVVTILDQGGTIRYESPAVERMLGYEHDTLLGRSFLDFTHPEDRDGTGELFHQVLRHPGAPTPFRMRFQHRDGSWRWLEGVATNLLHDRAVAGVVANSRDITERVEMEEALGRTQEELQAIVAAQQEVATAGLDRVDVARQIAARAQALTGATGAVVEFREGEEMVYEAASGSLEPHVGLRVPIEGSLSGRCVRTGELLRSDDTETDPRVDRAATRRVGARSLALVPLFGWEGAIGVLKVLSPQPGAFGDRSIQILQLMGGLISAALRDAEAYRVQSVLLQENRTYSTELERSNRELLDFAHIASHDLQEPLRKIQAFGDRLKSRYAAELDEKGADYLERMQGAAGRMQVLIDDLLEYSRVTSKVQPFQRVCLGEIVEAVVSDLSNRIEHSGGEVRVGELPRVEADPSQVRQLLQNLIANALKFHREGVPPRVEVSGRVLEHGTAELRVSDNGIGFDEQYAERIFQPFERLHGRADYEGTGMGLAVCRKIAERHGGSITARSDPGGGATFTVTLPLFQKDAA